MTRGATHPRRGGARSGRALLAALLVGAASASAPPAAATWGDPAFQTEEISAFTLRSGELKVGPAALRVGLPGGFQLGSRFALNLLGAINGELKWNIYRTEAFALGVEGGIIYFDADLVGIDEPFDVLATPVRLALSFVPLDELQIHVHLASLLASPDGQAPDAVLRAQRFMGPVGKLAAELYVEWRFHEHFGVIADYAAPLVMHEPELLYASEDPSGHGAQMRVALSLMATFETFNVRAGIGYGPSLLGTRGPFPILDFYWRIF